MKARWLGALGLVAVVSACGTSEPSTPDEAVAATWISFTDQQKQEACSFALEGRSTYRSTYIAERAVKLYPQFVENDLYLAAGAADDASRVFSGETAVEEPICDPYRAPEDRMPQGATP